MPILVLNSGSSSIKFSVFEVRTGADPGCCFDAELSGIGGDAMTLHVHTSGDTKVGPEAISRTPHTRAEAIQAIFDIVSTAALFDVEAVGYRVVHPGPRLTDHTLITSEVLEDLEQAVAFAPLHEPSAIDVIRVGMARFPSIGHFACFDTIFHRTMPAEAVTYPLPESLREQGVRRYGFHGLSCESVLYQFKNAEVRVPKRCIIAHLGSGCSVTALLDGCSIDTTMGVTPTGGVIMGTRPGDLDPGLLLYLLRQQEGSGAEAIRAVETMLNHHSGMVALSALPNDMRSVRHASADGNLQAILALKVFTRSITKALGAYCFLLGGLDMIVFTGGIGEHDAATRADTLDSLTSLGIEVDPSRNLALDSGLRTIHASNSETAIFVVPAQEDLMIAMHVARLAGSEK